MLRWGTPLLIIEKVSNDSSKKNLSNNKPFIEWIGNWRYADKVVGEMRNVHKYGLGKAIGHKACRLFIKSLIHTYKIINSSDSKWDDNSYQNPLDSNIGRILMRSGYVFHFIKESEFLLKCCTKQNGKVNLAANKMRDLAIDRNDYFYSDCLSVVRSWSRQLRSVKFPVSLNAFVTLLKSEKIKSSIGRLDDGMMYLGKEYCHNKSPDCKNCKLNLLCTANIQEPQLKENFYCGRGKGVFY